MAQPSRFRPVERKPKILLTALEEGTPLRASGDSPQGLFVSLRGLPSGPIDEGRGREEAEGLQKKQKGSPATRGSGARTSPQHSPAPPRRCCRPASPPRHSQPPPRSAAPGAAAPRQPWAGPAAAVGDLAPTAPAGFCSGGGAVRACLPGLGVAGQQLAGACAAGRRVGM